MKIPKKIHQIWIGTLPAPEKWIGTWPKNHPDWEYRLWGNEDLEGRVWRNQKHIDFYKSMGLWAGVADLMRYEILYEEGGFMPGADSKCLRPLDELFEDDFSNYAVSTAYKGEGEVVMGNLGAVAPLYACIEKSKFARQLIENLYRTNNLFDPVKSTGNRFMQKMIKKYDPKIKIWPMHFLLPEHFNGWKYSGPDKPFATHFWGTTRGTYDQGR